MITVVKTKRLPGKERGRDLGDKLGLRKARDCCAVPATEEACATDFSCGVRKGPALLTPCP